MENGCRTMVRVVLLAAVVLGGKVYLVVLTGRGERIISSNVDSRAMRDLTAAWRRKCEQEFG